MAQFEKHFTVEEANALLPEVQEVLEQVRDLSHALVVDWRQAAPVLRVVHQNGGGKETSTYLSTLRRLSQRVERLTQLGIQLKDADQGLIDFPHWRDGREVFLCWRLGEGDIEWWHDLDSGFAGRQPL